MKAKRNYAMAIVMAAVLVCAVIIGAPTINAQINSDAEISKMDKRLVDKQLMEHRELVERALANHQAQAYVNSDGHPFIVIEVPKANSTLLRSISISSVGSDFVSPASAEIVFIGTLDEIRQWGEYENNAPYSLLQMRPLSGMPDEMRENFIHAIYHFYDKDGNVTRHIDAILSFEDFEGSFFRFAQDASDFEVVFVGIVQEGWDEN